MEGVGRPALEEVTDCENAIISVTGRLMVVLLGHDSVLHSEV